MKVTSLLVKLKKENIMLSVVDGTLKIQDPSGVMTAELLDEIKVSKDKIIKFIDQNAWFDLPENQSDAPIRKQEHYEVAFQLEKEYKRFLLIGDFAFNLMGVMQFENLNKQVLQKVVSTLYERHEILRTTFHKINGEVRQRVHDHDAGYYKIESINLIDDENRDETVSEVLRNASNLKFNFENNALIDIKVIEYSHTISGLLLVLHHAISDVQSIEILKKEIAALYDAYNSDAQNPLPQMKFQFKDYSRWVNDFLKSKQLLSRQFYAQKILQSLEADRYQSSGNDRSYRKRLERELKVLLKKDHVEAYKDNYGYIVNIYPDPGASYSTCMTDPLFTKFKRLAADCKVSSFTVLLACYAIVLGEVLKKKNIRIALPVSTRIFPEFQNMIGWLISEIVLCIEVDASLSFRKFVCQVANTFAETANHRFYPLERILNDLDLPLNEVVDVFVNFVEDQDSADDGLRSVHHETGSGHFNLSCTLYQLANCLKVSADYNLKVYKPDDLEKIFNLFNQLLESVIKNPGYPITEHTAVSSSQNRGTLDWFHC